MKKPLPVSKKVNGKRTLSDDDLWEHVIESVKPLQGDLKNRAIEKEIWSTLDNVVLDRSQRNRSLSSFSNNLGRPASLPILSHGTHAGLDKSNAKKLKKGKHPIEGQIDLHGMNQKQAYVATNDFIK